MTVTRIAMVATLLLGASALAGWDQGGMLDPAIDTPGELFSYFWHPTRRERCRPVG